VTKSRLRNLALPIGLAVLAAVLVGIYVISYRNSVNHGADLEKVLVAARDIPAGTPGSSVAGGGYLKEQTVPNRAVVPGAVVSGAPLTGLVVDGTIMGPAVTLRQPSRWAGRHLRHFNARRSSSCPAIQNQLPQGSRTATTSTRANTNYTVGGLNGHRAVVPGTART
jgi:hypothetical protein